MNQGTVQGKGGKALADRQNMNGQTCADQRGTYRKPENVEITVHGCMRIEPEGDTWMKYMGWVMELSR